jgi:biopolymer transport protein ExbD
MAAISAARGSRAPIVGINVTPFVDLVLVLLVIMMVSATYIVSQSLKVELPKAQNSDKNTSRLHVVTVTKDGQLHYNQKAIQRDALGRTLKDASAQDPKTNLVISADRGALHGQVVDVIDLAKTSGITRFAINVEQTR